MNLKDVMRFCITKIQGRPFYRKIVQSLGPKIEVKEANREDMRKLNSWFNPRDPGVSRLDPEVATFVAKKKDKIIGFAQLAREREKNSPYFGYWLTSLNVKTLYRRMGIAERLIRIIIEKTRQEGIKELSLLVRENNRQAIALYKKFGFLKRITPALEEKLAGSMQVILTKTIL